MVAIFGRNGEGRLCNASDGAVIRPLTGLRTASADCTFTEDGQRVVGGDSEGRVVVWRVADGSVERVLQATGRELFRLLRLKGDLIAVAQRTANVPVWDAATGRPAFELSKSQGSNWCLAVSPDSAKLAVGFFQGVVEIWDLTSGTLDVSIDAHSRTVRHLAFSNDGRALASTAGDGPAKLWDAHTGLFLTRLGRESALPGVVGQPTNLVFLPGSDVFVTTFEDGRVEALDTDYFDRHIAGNLEHQLALHSAELGERVDAAAVREWGAKLRTGSTSARQQP